MRRVFFKFGTWVIAGIYLTLCACSPESSPPVAKTRAQWLQQATQQLGKLGPPSPDLKPVEHPWISRDYMLFSNDWASYAVHTAHASPTIGDVALLRTPDGSFYISDHHFCMGMHGDYGAPDQPRPTDFTHFLKLYGSSHRWMKY